MRRLEHQDEIELSAWRRTIYDFDVPIDDTYVAHGHTEIINGTPDLCQQLDMMCISRDFIITERATVLAHWSNAVNRTEIDFCMVDSGWDGGRPKGVHLRSRSGKDVYSSPRELSQKVSLPRLCLACLMTQYEGHKGLRS